ncbi:MAG: hypothetical protein CL780_01600 [Chloroflexi bacterium]|nr:hypothetical protein [Chloroflexota bacterium]|tara:strand:- start:2516 stop:3163 length:648 start_codon:yes stop_codon:yes gene_type:complete
MIDISKNNEGEIALNYLIKVSPEFINISEETGTLNLEPIKDRTIFVSLVRAVINQQISGKASEKIYFNLIQNIGNGKHIKPTDISRSTLENLLDCGISKNKSACIKEIAHSVINKQIPNIQKMDSMSDEQIVKSLIVIKGIGTWTAEMILMFKLGRKDIMPIKDLAVLRGFQKLFNYNNKDSLTLLEKKSKKWKPYRSYAALYLYKAAGSKSIVA